MMSAYEMFAASATIVPLGRRGLVAKMDMRVERLTEKYRPTIERKEPAAEAQK